MKGERSDETDLLRNDHSACECALSGGGGEVSLSGERLGLILETSLDRRERHAESILSIKARAFLASPATDQPLALWPATAP